MNNSMYKLIVAAASILIFSSLNVSAAPPVQNVNIVKQPIRVIGKVAATINEPLGVEVINSQASPLNVIVDPSSRAGLTHAWQPIDKHVQLQSVEYPLTSSGIVDMARISPFGGGSAFTLDPGECLVITELHLAYTSAASSVASFRFGLTDEVLSSVYGVRFLVDIPNENGAGVISKTFPSGLIITPGEHSPEHNKIGLETFNARIRNLSSSGYVMPCLNGNGYSFEGGSFTQRK
jgi:hypothetical protein